MKRWSYLAPGLLLGAAVFAAAPGTAPPGTAPPAPAKAAACLEKPVRLKADGAFIDTGAAWGHASPWLVDIDGDGKRDLIVGDFSGKFRVFLNTGTNARPVYKSAGFLQAGGVDAHVPIY
jgi:hypothetical protein